MPAPSRVMPTRQSPEAEVKTSTSFSPRPSILTGWVMSGGGAGPRPPRLPFHAENNRVSRFMTPIIAPLEQVLPGAQMDSALHPLHQLRQHLRDAHEQAVRVAIGRGHEHAAREK